MSKLSIIFEPSERVQELLGMPGPEMTLTIELTGNGIKKPEPVTTKAAPVGDKPESPKAKPKKQGRPPAKKADSAPAKQAVKKVKAEEAAKPAKSSPSDDLTFVEMKKALLRLRDATSREEAFEVLKIFNAENLSELDETDYSEFMGLVKMRTEKAQ